jgi:hypothetical protein
MNPFLLLKLFGLFLALLLVLNLILASLRKISWLTFWLVLVLIAFISYWGIPLVKKRLIL